MIFKENDKIIVKDASEKWLAEHPITGTHGPVKLSHKKDTVLIDCLGYIGDISETSTVCKKTKDYHKSGCSYIETEGFFAYPDGKTTIQTSYRYSNRRLRVSADISFLGTCPISRHFGLGSLFLPGKWQSLHVIPAAHLLANGAKARTSAIPEYKDKNIMLGHWHRPPLAVTFIRPNGTSIEVGTGSDVWRWEENLGYDPESGSYKIILEKDGIRFIREPLACCEEYYPENRSYKLSWYLAWREHGANKVLPEHQVLNLSFDKQNEPNTAEINEKLAQKSLPAFVVLDFNELIWHEKQTSSLTSYDFIRNIKTPYGCWASSTVMTKIKNIVRKLTGVEGLDGIIFKNFAPKICFDTQHVNKKHPNGTVHWDVNSLFDFASWANASCHNKLQLIWGDEETVQPSLLGLFD